MIDEWNHAATSGTLETYDGDPPPRIHPTTVGWMSKRMGNDCEARRVVFPAAGAFVVFAVVMMMVLVVMAL